MTSVAQRFALIAGVHSPVYYLILVFIYKCRIYTYLLLHIATYSPVPFQLAIRLNKSAGCVSFIKILAHDVSQSEWDPQTNPC